MAGRGQDVPKVGVAHGGLSSHDVIKYDQTHGAAGR
jgi:hypothetical protein